MPGARPLPSPLRGIIVPMVTPLASADALDAQGLERLVDRLLGGDVHGLFLLGTCGEGPSLSPRLQRELIEHVCRQVDGRLPVLVGVTDSSPVQSTALARHAADAGADAIVIAPPFYFPLEQTELLAYVEQQAADSPLPVMLYNMPGLCKVVYEPETVRRLLDNPRVMGLKDSSGDLDYFRRVRELTRGRADWSLLIGPEHLLDEAIALGGHGGVSGGANILPQLYVKYYEAAVAGFVDEAAIFERDVALLGHIYTVGAAGGLTASSVVKGLKAALTIQGVCSGLPCPPLAPLSAGQVEQVRQILRDVGASRAAAVAAQQQ
jgi:dihydrodipicolinate synthase/N-acetylneuraminate lyase